MGELTFTEFKAYADSFYEASKGEYRYGQAIFNALSHVRPDIANRLAGSRIDPFFENDVSKPAWDFIEILW